MYMEGREVEGRGGGSVLTSIVQGTKHENTTGCQDGRATQKLWHNWASCSGREFNSGSNGQISRHSDRASNGNPKISAPQTNDRAFSMLSLELAKYSIKGFQ